MGVSREPKTGRSAKLAPRAKKSAKPSGEAQLEAMLATIETVRLAQRQEGNFDCFARAVDGYCDQLDCAHREECLRISVSLV